MSRNSSSKSHMFLMEFICVVMFFALCAALCINGFVKAEKLSNRGTMINQGLIAAESLAENIKGMSNPDIAGINKMINEANDRNKEFEITGQATINDDMLSVKIFVEKDEVSLCDIEVKKYVPDGGKYE